jgi:hypothetical protein
MSKPIHIYKISKDYRSCEVWQGARMTQSRIAVYKRVPDRGLSREERHEVIASWLYSEFGVPGPCYRETTKGKQP